MCRIDLCGQIGVKISSYRDRQFIKINPLNRPWGRFLPREDSLIWCYDRENWFVHIIYASLKIIENRLICVFDR